MSDIFLREGVGAWHSSYNIYQPLNAIYSNLYSAICEYRPVAHKGRGEIFLVILKVGGSAV